MVEAKNRKGGDMLQQLTKQNTHLIFILGYTQNITANWAKEPFQRNSSVSNKKSPKNQQDLELPQSVDRRCPLTSSNLYVCSHTSCKILNV